MQSGLPLEKSFRMAKSDLQARPIYHRTRDSIEAHLTIVFAALAVSRWVEHRTGWSIRKFVKTTRRYRTIQIQAGDHLRPHALLTVPVPRAAEERSRGRGPVPNKVARQRRRRKRGQRGQGGRA
jgi:hypothetical protein